MSKFEWKDLPNWLGVYPHANDVSPEERGWELLRRNPHYVRCWKSFQRWNLKDKWAFRPKKRPEQSYEGWLKRCWLEGVAPTYQPVEVYLARKWGLQRLLDPTLPYNPQKGFRESIGQFPRQMFMREELLDVLDSEDSHLTDMNVRNNLAVIAFDMRMPVGKQMKAASKIAMNWQTKMVEAGLVIVKDMRGEVKIDAWSQHIRVLDALRTVPRPTQKQIAIAIGVDARQNPDKRGKQLVDGARQAMKNYHRYIYPP